MTDKATGICVHCGQKIHRPLLTWDTDEFQSDWVNPFGFPWCPLKRGQDLTPHKPEEAEEAEQDKIIMRDVEYPIEERRAAFRRHNQRNR